jgi:hypothetical protein
VGDSAAAIDQHADLPATVAAELGHRPGKFLIDNAIRGDAASRETFELPNIVGLQALRIAEDLDRVSSPMVGPRSAGCRSRPDLATV